ncbi:gI [Suid alphaherpesvirus 1]|uniref:Envelope glycoprotein I n=2 Tax=Suid herpesvirus 1 TaxID=10345 RepID=I1WXB9_SUHV|nr:gI [Suid alphaherpesvirus 1]AEM64040.1 gI [Suid alphaherpesvirus 1]AFI70843.1 US7 [Suid alphaherpesvirus 1]AFI70913.1 US7 [Suid alphaherpesvirus 1]AID18780.1 US7 [Suid alphaherpesvirus 1]
MMMVARDVTRLPAGLLLAALTLAALTPRVGGVLFRGAGVSVHVAGSAVLVPGDAPNLTIDGTLLFLEGPSPSNYSGRVELLRLDPKRACYTREYAAEYDLCPRVHHEAFRGCLRKREPLARRASAAVEARRLLFVSRPAPPDAGSYVLRVRVNGTTDLFVLTALVPPRGRPHHPTPSSADECRPVVGSWHDSLRVVDPAEDAVFTTQPPLEPEPPTTPAPPRGTGATPEPRSDEEEEDEEGATTAMTPAPGTLDVNDTMVNASVVSRVLLAAANATAGARSPGKIAMVLGPTIVVLLIFLGGVACAARRCARNRIYRPRPGRGPAVHAPPPRRPPPSPVAGAPVPQPKMTLAELRQKLATIAEEQ